jgi:radical SAM protein (TIGR01212 family)
MPDPAAGCDGPPFGGQYYNSIGDYLKERFGCKVIKLSLNAGFTCPNRDGTKGTGGCIFCSAEGSGDFASDIPGQIRLLSRKWPSGKYIAYFQSHTNTYASWICSGKSIMQRCEYPDVIGLPLPTRPDCLPPEVLELLSELNQKTFFWVELGLQTIHEDTARLINRCYPLEVFDRAVEELSRLGIKTVVHLILGLPGESREDMLASVRYVCGKNIFGIKLHLLNVLKDTKLAEYYPCRLHIPTKEGTSILWLMHSRSFLSILRFIGSPPMLPGTCSSLRSGVMKNGRSSTDTGRNLKAGQFSGIKA